MGTLGIENERTKKKYDTSNVHLKTIQKEFYDVYMNKEYISLCSRISKHAYNIADHQDIGFAEIQRYFNVYAFDDPFFYQTSSNGTDQPLSSYPTTEVFTFNRHYWKPTRVC